MFLPNGILSKAKPSKRNMSLFKRKSFPLKSIFPVRTTKSFDEMPPFVASTLQFRTSIVHFSNFTSILSSFTSPSTSLGVIFTSGRSSRIVSILLNGLNNGLINHTSGLRRITPSVPRRLLLMGEVASNSTNLKATGRKSALWIRYSRPFSVSVFHAFIFSSLT